VGGISSRKSSPRLLNNVPINADRNKPDIRKINNSSTKSILLNEKPNKINNKGIATIP